jgi:hypothetical protein
LSLAAPGDATRGASRPSHRVRAIGPAECTATALVDRLDGIAVAELREGATLMRMTSRFGMLGVLMVAVCGFGGSGCKKSQAQPQPGKPTAGWYDATPLLASLRPSARVDVAKAAGVKSLEDLPLYDLGLSLDVAKGTFTLDEEIWFTNVESKPLDEVVLRIYANSSEGGTAGAKKPLVSLVKGSCVAPSCMVKTEHASTIAVKPSSPIAPGAHLRIQLTLKGELDVIEDGRTNVFAQSLESLSTLGGGEGAGNYGILAQGDGISSMANFYPVLARRRDSKWERDDASTVGDLGSDEMAHVKARIEVAPDVHVATSGVAVSDKIVGTHRVVEVDAAMVRDFAVVSSKDFAVETVMVGDVEVRSHYLAKEKKAGSKVLDTARWALEDYEKRFGPYPYADLDVVEAPLIGGAGGVEFAGLVTIASMFYRPPLPSDGLGGLLQMLLPKGPSGSASPVDEMMDSMLEFVTAHEVAHQYWHGLVGSDSRLHPYLDEGLAQWTAITYLEDRYGEAKAKQIGDMNVAMNYKVMRLLGNEDAAVDRPASEFANMVTYAGLVYGKGPYLWSAIRAELGDKAYFDAMRSYVAKNRLRLAPPRALIDEFAAADPAKAAKVRALAKRWLDEAHGDDDLGKGNLLELLGPSIGLDPKSIDPEIVNLMQDLLESPELGDLLEDLLND